MFKHLYSDRFYDRIMDEKELKLTSACRPARVAAFG